MEVVKPVHKVAVEKPAIEGGKPARETFLTFGRPSIGEEEIAEVVATLRSGWLSSGEKSLRFAEEVRRFVGAKHCVATNSCTAALHLALAYCGVGPGDEVITSPMTFAATANVILHCGARPVFADVTKGGFHIDPRDIELRITRHTKAIIPVHYAGLACDMGPILEIARRRGVRVIEDAAHAIGTEYEGRRIGSLGEFTCFSFYVTKNVVTGEGGAITTDDPEAYDWLRRMSLHGLDLDAWQRYSPVGFKHYEIIYPGFKYNLTDLAASIGLHQMRRLPEFIRVRERYAKRYEEAFADLEEVILPRDADNGVHAWHLYPILVRPERLRITRDQMIEALHRENIGVGIHYRAVHLQKYYRETFGFKRGDFPNAEFISDRVLSLPLYPAMTEADVQDSIRAVRKLVQYYRR